MTSRGSMAKQLALDLSVLEVPPHRCARVEGSIEYPMAIARRAKGRCSGPLVFSRPPRLLVILTSPADPEATEALGCLATFGRRAYNRHSASEAITASYRALVKPGWLAPAPRCPYATHPPVPGEFHLALRRSLSWRASDTRRRCPGAGR